MDKQIIRVLRIKEFGFYLTMNNESEIRFYTDDEFNNLPEKKKLEITEGLI